MPETIEQSNSGTPPHAGRTYLDLPNHMAEAYMDAAFQHGPQTEVARSVYERFSADPEWGQLFQEFARAVDELKSAVSSGVAAQGAAHLDPALTP